jgi:hypothetical protein
MNIIFWFMIALGVIGLLRVPSSRRSSAAKAVRIVVLCVALFRAAILLYRH